MNKALDELLTGDWSYAIRYAACAVRGLELPTHARPEAVRWQRWTPDMDGILRARYIEHATAGTIAVLAGELGRTPESLYERARKLGLRKGRP